MLRSLDRRELHADEHERALQDPVVHVRHNDPAAHRVAEIQIQIQIQNILVTQVKPAEAHVLRAGAAPQAAAIPPGCGASTYLTQRHRSSPLQVQLRGLLVVPVGPAPALLPLQLQQLVILQQLPPSAPRPRRSCAHIRRRGSRSRDAQATTASRSRRSVQPRGQWSAWHSTTAGSASCRQQREAAAAALQPAAAAGAATAGVRKPPPSAAGVACSHAGGGVRGTPPPPPATPPAAHERHQRPRLRKIRA